MRLYAVTDRAWVGQGTLGDQVEQALRGGVTCVCSCRGKISGSPCHFGGSGGDWGTFAGPMGSRFSSMTVWKSPYSAARTASTWGKKDRAAREVRRLLGPNRILGVSARTVEQAVQAERDGADYLGVGAVFSTSTKADAMPVSYETLQAICRAVSIPVVAIGGIQRENLLSLTGSGVDGVALVSAILPRRMWKRPAGSFRALSEAMVRA